MIYFLLDDLISYWQPYQPRTNMDCRQCRNKTVKCPSVHSLPAWKPKKEIKCNRQTQANKEIYVKRGNRSKWSFDGLQNLNSKNDLGRGTIKTWTPVSNSSTPEQGDMPAVGRVGLSASLLAFPSRGSGRSPVPGTAPPAKRHTRLGRWRR